LSLKKHNNKKESEVNDLWKWLKDRIMSYSANVYNVMIASPGDVAKEKQLAREVVLKWNDLHSKQTKIVLLTISWETHSSPELGDRPQAIINKQVLKDADLLIGIFWTRIGTPTGKAESGTLS
jgi:hypothetical protein